jgi:hypothetical protein
MYLTPTERMPSALSLSRRARKSERGVRARIRSILDDAEWVATLPASPSLPPSTPTFANLRTGSWYVDPASAASAYFKSTDGHVGCWLFSPTRLNLPVAVAAGERGAVLVVDATRHGKRFPDALARTVPLWAAVVNTIVFGEGGPGPDIAALLPPFVPPSEKSLLRARLPAILAGVPAPVREAIATSLRGVLTKPLRTHFVAQPSARGRKRGAARGGGGKGVVGGSDEDEEDDDDDDDDDAFAGLAGGSGLYSLPVLTGPGAIPAAADYAHVICVSASRVVPATGDAWTAEEGWEYVPGAGDDAENWTREVPGGVNPRLLWMHADELRRAATDEDVVRILTAPSEARSEAERRGVAALNAAAGRGTGTTHPSRAALVASCACAAAVRAGSPASIGRLLAADEVDGEGGRRRRTATTKTTREALPRLVLLVEQPLAAGRAASAELESGTTADDGDGEAASPRAQSSSSSSSSSSCAERLGRAEGGGPCVWRLRVPSDKRSLTRNRTLWTAHALPAVWEALDEALKGEGVEEEEDGRGVEGGDDDALPRPLVAVLYAEDAAGAAAVLVAAAAHILLEVAGREGDGLARVLPPVPLPAAAGVEKQAVRTALSLAQLAVARAQQTAAAAAAASSPSSPAAGLPASTGAPAGLVLVERGLAQQLNLFLLSHKGRTGEGEEGGEG